MKLLLPFISLVCFSFTSYKCAAQSTSNSSDKICDDTLCVKYYNIWKNIFMKRSGMTEKYFKNHVKVQSDSVVKNKAQEMFEVHFTTTIDWASSRGYDNFTIRVNYLPNSPRLNIRYDSYFTQEEIEAELDKSGGAGMISTRTAAEHLKIADKETAVQVAMAEVADEKKRTDRNQVIYFRGGKNNNGHPWLQYNYNSPYDSNFTVYVDLLTGVVQKVNSHRTDP